MGRRMNQWGIAVRKPCERALDDLVGVRSELPYGDDSMPFDSKTTVCSYVAPRGLVWPSLMAVRLSFAHPVLEADKCAHVTYQYGCY